MVGERVTANLPSIFVFRYLDYILLRCGRFGVGENGDLALHSLRGDSRHENDD